jgi:hypothetical protein
MKEQIINIDIYKRSVVILQDGCVGDICKWLEEHNATDIAQSVREEDWDTANAITFSDGLDVFIISPKQIEVKTLAHELTHATFKVLKIAGINPVQEEEAFAYLYEYLYDKAINEKEEK